MTSGLENRIESSSIQGGDEQNPIIYLETNLCSDTSSLDILAVHQNGRVRCLSEDLSVEHWISVVELGEQSVQYVTTINIEQARSGLLKNREDIAAVLLEGSAVDTAVPSLLVFVTSDSESTSQGHVMLRLFQPAQHHDTAPVAVDTGILKELLSIEISRPEELENESSQYHFHKPSGRLYQYQSKSIAFHDLSILTGNMSRLMHVKSNFQSCLRLSSNALAITDSNFISILDTRHSSVQAQESVWRSNATMGDDNGLEKLENQPQRTQLLSYFPSSSTIIALQERTLLAFHVGGMKGSGLNYKCGALADAVGRGTAFRSSKHDPKNSYIPPQLGRLIDVEIQEKKWETREHELDALVHAEEADEFDKCFSKALGLHFHDEDLDLNLKRYISSPTDLMKCSHKISSILNKLFKLDWHAQIENSEKQLQLRCVFLPTKTFQWLVVNNLLTQHGLELALTESSTLGLAQALPPCSIIRALSTFDASLQTLMYLLAATTPLTAREIICAMRYAIIVLQQSHNLSNMQLITAAGDEASESGSDAEMPLTNGNLSHRSKSAEPEQDADRIHDAHAVMRTCLARLSQYHDSEIQKAFKQELPSVMLGSFVDFLRAELAGGGWFSRYSDDTVLSQEELNPYSSQITIIAKLLNCAINCLGASAWLLDSTSSNENVDKIAYLKAEISAALEGIEEATYVQGLVHEVLLASKYAVKMPKHDKGSKGAKVNEIGMSLAKPVTMGTGDSETNALPLGLKPAGYMDITTVSTRGEKRKRTMRDIGMLKSKKVGAYSFERILV